MPKEIAHFQNFAKLKDTKVEFNDIMVLAGKPGTGKSYVMKFMYAVSEMGYLLPLVDKNITQVMLNFSTIENSINKNIDGITLKNELIELLESKQYIKINELINKYLQENQLSEKAITELSILLNILQDKRITDSKPLQDKELHYLDNIIKAIFTHHTQMSLNYKIRYKNRDFIFNNKNFDIKFNKQTNFQMYSNKQPIFVETPLILEFKKFMDRREGKTPYHIESLLNILDTNYSFTDEEQDKFIKEFTQKSKAIIGGDIESNGDSFIFNQEGGQNYDILNASSGTKSIGLLQYLVTNKALKKGSVLFWEEPEVHLHPEWQLKMVDLFVELMNAGVKIVFSTHSPYMADYLNAISKKQKFRDRISFNVLDEKDGVVTNHILDDDNWSILQKELLDPLEDIAWEYL